MQSVSRRPRKEKVKNLGCLGLGQLWHLGEDKGDTVEYYRIREVLSEEDESKPFGPLPLHPPALKTHTCRPASVWRTASSKRGTHYIFANIEIIV